MFCSIILIQRMATTKIGTNVETFNNYHWRNVGFYLANFFTGMAATKTDHFARECKFGNLRTEQTKKNFCLCFD